MHNKSKAVVSAVSLAVQLSLISITIRYAIDDNFDVNVQTHNMLIIEVHYSSTQLLSQNTNYRMIIIILL